MTKRALITGITGQDGAYLAEFLFAGLSDKWEMIQLLNQRGVDINYSVDDSQSDLETLNKLLS